VRTEARAGGSAVGIVPEITDRAREDLGRKDRAREQGAGSLAGLAGVKRRPCLLA